MKNTFILDNGEEIIVDADKLKVEYQGETHMLHELPETVLEQVEESLILLLQVIDSAKRDSTGALI